MRTLVIAAFTAAGMVVGGALDLVYAGAVDGPTVPVATVGLGILGLVVGIFVAVVIHPRPRQPIDPADYPNRTFRRV